MRDRDVAWHVAYAKKGGGVGVESLGVAPSSGSISFTLDCVYKGQHSMETIALTMSTLSTVTNI